MDDPVRQIIMPEVGTGTIATPTALGIAATKAAKGDPTELARFLALKGVTPEYFVQKFMTNNNPEWPQGMGQPMPMAPPSKAQGQVPSRPASPAAPAPPAPPVSQPTPPVAPALPPPPALVGDARPMVPTMPMPDSRPVAEMMPDVESGPSEEAKDTRPDAGDTGRMLALAAISNPFAGVQVPASPDWASRVSTPSPVGRPPAPQGGNIAQILASLGRRGVPILPLNKAI